MLRTESAEEEGWKELRFDVDESAVVYDIFSERCRRSRREGREPEENDKFMVKSLLGMEEIKLSGDEGFIKYLRFVLNEYAFNSMTEAQSLQVCMGQEEGAANLAVQRFDRGIRAQDMVIQIEMDTALEAILAGPAG